jgi:hypothetical protein
MLKLGVAASLALCIADAAFAQAPTDHVKIDVTRADLQLIGQGIMKLPYETAAPLLIELQKQIEAQTSKPEASSAAGGTSGTIPPREAKPAGAAK